MPATALALQFPSEGFRIEQADDRRPYYFLSNGKTRLNVCFNFERATRCKSSESCRNYFAEKLKAGFPNKKNWRSCPVSEAYASENLDGPVSGVNLRQQHMNAHFGSCS